MGGHTSTCDYSIAPGRRPVPFQGVHRAAADDGLASCRPNARTFRRGEVIAMAGNLIDKFARVQRGLVNASTVLPDGREFIIEIIPKSGVIGELEVLRRQTSNLEYRAASDCELHFFEGRLLRERYASDPEFQEEVLYKALARVSELELRIISNAGSSLQSRLASTLLRLCDVYAKDTSNSRDELIISQQRSCRDAPGLSRKGQSVPQAIARKQDHRRSARQDPHP